MNNFYNYQSLIKLLLEVGVDSKQHGMFLSDFMDADLFDVDANEEPDAAFWPRSSYILLCA